MKTVTKHILHSHVSGQGETIVMLHGYLSSGQYFKHIRNKLESKYRIVTLDLLGFGQSPRPQGNYDYNDHIAAIHSTLTHLGITRFILLGHSMGGLIALRYATMYPHDITRLLLFNPPLFIDTSQTIAEHKATGRRYRIMLYSRARYVYWPLLRLLPKTTSRKRPAISFSDIVSMSPAAREGSYRHVLAGATVFEDFDKLTVPTLLVNGRHDREVYLQNLESHTLPRIVTTVTMESGHHPLVRNVDDAEQIVRSYLLE